MRLIFLFCLIGLASCTNSSNYTASSSDSLSIDSTLSSSLDSKPNLPDSVIKQQEKIAFGSMMFGMTEKEVDRLPEKDRELFQKIGEYEYEVSPLYNNEGRLYKVELQTLPKDANYIDTYVRVSHDNLKDVISAKYGEPKFEGSFPSVLTFQAGYIHWTSSWTVGKKKIFLGAGEVQDGAEFYADCWIYDQEMDDTQNKNENAKSDSLKKNDASKF